jgi:ATP-dependent exoDNAse (exonuclease V) beta subunit
MEALMEPLDFDILKKTLLASKKFNPAFVKKFGIEEEVFFNKRMDILKSYEDERNKSCERGTKIHADFENAFYKTEVQEIPQYGLGGKFVCKRDYFELDLEKGIYPEYLISKVSADGILRVAGQIDLMVKDGNDIYLFDYKTNKEIKQKSYYNKNKKSYECMKFPLANIMDTNY